MAFRLTVTFRGYEAEVLDRLARSGLFASKPEVVRSALRHLGYNLGLLRAEVLWASLEGVPRRRATRVRLLGDMKKADD